MFLGTDKAKLLTSDLTLGVKCTVTLAQGADIDFVSLALVATDGS